MAPSPPPTEAARFQGDKHELVQRVQALEERMRSLREEFEDMVVEDEPRVSQSPEGRRSGSGSPGPRSAASRVSPRRTASNVSTPRGTPRRGRTPAGAPWRPAGTQSPSASTTGAGRRRTGSVGSTRRVDHAAVVGRLYPAPAAARSRVRGGSPAPSSALRRAGRSASPAAAARPRSRSKGVKPFCSATKANAVIPDVTEADAARRKAPLAPPFGDATREVNDWLAEGCVLRDDRSEPTPRSPPMRYGSPRRNISPVVTSVTAGPLQVTLHGASLGTRDSPPPVSPVWQQDAPHAQGTHPLAADPPPQLARPSPRGVPTTRYFHTADDRPVQYPFQVEPNEEAAGWGDEDEDEHVHDDPQPSRPAYLIDWEGREEDTASPHISPPMLAVPPTSEEQTEQHSSPTSLTHLASPLKKYSLVARRISPARPPRGPGEAVSVWDVGGPCSSAQRPLAKLPPQLPSDDFDEQHSPLSRDGGGELSVGDEGDEASTPTDPTPEGDAPIDTAPGDAQQRDCNATTDADEAEPYQTSSLLEAPPSAHTENTVEASVSVSQDAEPDAAQHSAAAGVPPSQSNGTPPSPSQQTCKSPPSPSQQQYYKSQAWPGKPKGSLVKAQPSLHCKSQPAAVRRPSAMSAFEGSQDGSRPATPLGAAYPKSPAGSAAARRMSRDRRGDAGLRTFSSAAITGPSPPASPASHAPPSAQSSVSVKAPPFRSRSGVRGKPAPAEAPPKSPHSNSGAKTAPSSPLRSRPHASTAKHPPSAVSTPRSQALAKAPPSPSLAARENSFAKSAPTTPTLSGAKHPPSAPSTPRSAAMVKSPPSPTLPPPGNGKRPPSTGGSSRSRHPPRSRRGSKGTIPRPPSVASALHSVPVTVAPRK